MWLRFIITMGYNGGINKRGYYRRYSGMVSKSSYRSGGKIASNAILGGLGLLGAGINALSEIADSAPDIMESDYRHFSPRRHCLKHIICGIIALLCPIASFATFTFVGWPIFFSILLFGIVEIIPCAASCNLEMDLTYGRYYYQHEVEELVSKCKRNIKIQIVFLITLFILNLYPFVYLVLDFTGNDYFEWWGFASELTILLYVIKMFANGSLIILAFNELKSADKTIADNARKEKPCKTSTEITQVSSPTDQVINDYVNQKDRKEEDPTKITDDQSVETIDLVLDQRILNTIKNEFSLETIYYYGEDLMTEDSFSNQLFSLQFKQKWFTYEEYKYYWNAVHYELSLYSKAHLLAIDIITKDAISLEDFKDISVFESKRDSILNERLNDKEQKVLNRLKTSRKLSHDCLIFSYLRIRSIKLEAQEDLNKSLFSIECAYEHCLRDVLDLGMLYNFHPFYITFMDVKYDLHNDPLNLT